MAQVHRAPKTATLRGAGAGPAEAVGSLRSRTVKLGGAVTVPYPVPGNEAATRVGQGNRRMNTKPELLIRSALHRRGLRYRKDLPIRVGEVRVRPDVVFTRPKVAVFIDGCFWHRCPDHATTPQRNLEYWLPKLQANVDRDQRVQVALVSEGWAVVRVWEHEVVGEAVDRIAWVVRWRQTG